MTGLEADEGGAHGVAGGAGTDADDGNGAGEDLRDAGTAGDAAPLGVGVGEGEIIVTATVGVGSGSSSSDSVVLKSSPQADFGSSYIGKLPSTLALAARSGTEGRAGYTSDMGPSRGVNRSSWTGLSGKLSVDDAGRANVRTDASTSLGVPSELMSAPAMDNRSMSRLLGSVVVLCV